LLFQFPKVLRLKAPNQANRRHSAVRILFDLQISTSMIEPSASKMKQLLCQHILLNERGVYTAQNCRLIRNADSSEK